MKKYTMLIVLALALIVMSAMFGGFGGQSMVEAVGSLDDNSDLRFRYGITATPRELNYTDGVTSALQTQLDAKSTSTLANTKVFIGSAGGLAVAQSIGTGHSLTAAGALTHIGNTVSSADILNGTITASDMNRTVYVVNVASGVASTTETVTSGALIDGYWPIANISSEIVNGISISGTTLTLVLNTTSNAEVVYQVKTIAP